MTTTFEDLYAAYNNNEPVQRRDVYEARRMAKRMKRRIEQQGRVAV